MLKNNYLNYFGIIGAVLFIITTIIGGFLFEGYSHISQYISESYADGTDYGPLVRWLGYIPSGLLIGIFCFLEAGIFKGKNYIYLGLIGFGIFYGIFTSLVSIFPCDFGCNRNHSDPSLSQLIHIVLSLFTYLLTPISVFLVGIGFKVFDDFKVISRLSIVLAIVGFIFGMIFILNANSPIAGLLQRNTEAVYLFWIIYLSVILMKYNKKIKQ